MNMPLADRAMSFVLILIAICFITLIATIVLAYRAHVAVQALDTMPPASSTEQADQLLRDGVFWSASHDR